METINEQKRKINLRKPCNEIYLYTHCTAHFNLPAWSFLLPGNFKVHILILCNVIIKKGKGYF